MLERNQRRELRFYCFSAPVMMATFIIEIALALWVIATRKMTTTLRLGVCMLVCLATFQLSEYAICEFWGFSSTTWTRIGFTAITMLPSLGLHLVYAIANKKNRGLILGGYVLAIVWIGIFILTNTLQGAHCGDNYVIFDIPNPYEGLYYIFYDALVALAMYMAYYFARGEKNKHRKRALISLIIAYAAFIVPSIIFVSVDSYVGDNSPLPSIMCGFALILAVILAGKTLPEAERAIKGRRKK